MKVNVSVSIWYALSMHRCVHLSVENVFKRSISEALSR